ncbi:MAG: polysaccharide deacetylase family protein [Pseudomonadota bacterium]|nr:polysaccharide deacetylase family protein [Pseudomonadota bacterium]
MLLASCASAPAPTTAAAPSVAPARVAKGEVLGRSDRFLIYQPSADDTLATIAAQFLGETDRDWVIGDFNGLSKPIAGQPLVVPLKPINPMGVQGDRYQTVPILCYHRFGGASSKMSVSPANFAAQLDWLARNDYRVIRLSQLAGFLQGREALPKRAVVITMDDGYESVHRHALPVLRKYGFPATLFTYTDFIGAGDALSWGQLAELKSSGLVDIQAHSKTHRNLIERVAGETDEKYRQSLDTEMRAPRELLERRLAIQVSQFAFPYGDANEAVLEALTRQQYQLAVTVYPGGNAFFAMPLMLRRTMIFGDADLEAFKAKLQISRASGAS